MPVKRHHISSLSRQTVIYHDFPSPCLIQHRHLHSVSKTAAAVRKNDIDIFYERIVTNFIIGDVVLYNKYAGTEVTLNKEEYVIVKQSDILAIVE